MRTCFSCCGIELGSPEDVVSLPHGWCMKWVTQKELYFFKENLLYANPLKSTTFIITDNLQRCIYPHDSHNSLLLNINQQTGCNKVCVLTLRPLSGLNILLTLPDLYCISFNYSPYCILDTKSSGPKCTPGWLPSCSRYKPACINT